MTVPLFSACASSRKRPPDSLRKAAALTALPAYSTWKMRPSGEYVVHE
jgi:hypothetical protein